MPLVRDVLVLGKQAAIGPAAMSRALNFLHARKFTLLSIEDEVIEGVFIRDTLLKKIPEQKVISLILQHVKPTMQESEILKIDLDVELRIEDVFL